MKLQFEQHKGGPPGGARKEQAGHPSPEGPDPAAGRGLGRCTKLAEVPELGTGMGNAVVGKPQGAAYAELALGVDEGIAASTACRGWGGHLHISPRYQGQPSAWRQ